MGVAIDLGKWRNWISFLLTKVNILVLSEW